MLTKTLPLVGILAAGALLTACDEPVDTGEKGRIDKPALRGGVSVTISGALGVVEVPFVTPVPEVDDEDLQATLAHATTLLITSNQSGVTVDLASGTPVAYPPSGPGEWSWELDPERDDATMTFYNATVHGLGLDSGAAYTASLAIVENNYIEEQAQFAFPVTVIGP